ncbi:hypothetical protein [Ferrimonas senticii]|nr:hypothetical protein [Ferrimonas senticii]
MHRTTEQSQSALQWLRQQPYYPLVKLILGSYTLLALLGFLAGCWLFRSL